MDLFHSVEFYVTILVIAALAVGILAMPSGHGPVETSFSEGQLSFNPDLKDTTPRIEIDCQTDGTVKITRVGIPDNINSAATVALAITRKGFDISIEERITPDNRAMLSSETTPVNTAIYHLTNLARERYHLKFNSDSTSSFTAVTFINRPGIHSTRIFRQA